MSLNDFFASFYKAIFGILSIFQKEMSIGCFDHIHSYAHPFLGFQKETSAVCLDHIHCCARPFLGFGSQNAMRTKALPQKADALSAYSLKWFQRISGSKGANLCKLFSEKLKKTLSIDEKE